MLRASRVLTALSMTSRYQPEKIRQAVAYIASKLPERGNMYKVLKVMYFADKEHLRRYGRMIFGDRYIALRHGPVPWSAYRRVSNVRDGLISADTKPEPLFMVAADHTIVPLLNADLDLECFSDSDLECINNEIDICAPLSFRELKQRSHDDAYRSADENDEMSMESIAAAAAQTQEERELLLSHLAEA